MTPELSETLCCGVVGGGVKLFTLGAIVCTFATHSKKVTIFPGHIYVSVGCQSAYKHHHAPVDTLTNDHST